MKKFIIIDGNSLMNRAFYALPLLTNTKGKYTNAMYGFINIIVKLLQENSPEYMAVAFDLKAPTFRHKLYKEYKGTRKPMPTELVGQMNDIKQVLNVMGIKIIEKSGYEADDIIGTMSRKFDEDVIIVSGDKDLFQLIKDNVVVWHTKKGISDIIKVDEKELIDLMGVKPYQIVELKSLMGDSSDNIPGVSGIGPKTATDLLNKYENLDNIYEHLDEIKASVKDKLLKDKETAYLSKQLATIDVNSPIECNIEECKVKFPFGEEVLNIFKEYEFKSLLKRENIFDNDIEKVQERKVVLENIDTESQLDNLIEELKTVNNFAIDISQDYVHLSTSKYKEYIIEIKSQLELVSLLQKLKPMLESEKIGKICFKAKNLMRFLISYDIKLNNIAFDVNLAEYLLNGGKEPLKNVDEVPNYYLSADLSYASSMLYAYEVESENLKNEHMYDLYYNVELPLIYVLFEMEQNGFKIDREECRHLNETYKTQINEIESQIYESAGTEFNINSPKQVAEILFDKLGLKTDKKRSTSVEILEKLQYFHPIVPLILKYRKLTKLQNTYLESFLKLMDKETNLIHTIFHQSLTTTGRLSSTEPNLQNIPVRDEEGKRLRKLFISRFENGKIVSADYSQIELRLMAHFSKDKNLIEAYKNGLDIHTKTASDIFDVSISEVTDEMRRKAKAVNFGIMYGISDFGLAQDINMTRNEAKAFLEKYYEKYSGVKEYMSSLIEKAKQDGYVSTLLGRRRKVDELNSSSYMTRLFGERITMNMPFQGSSADIIKLAMINVNNRLIKQNLKSKLILQIHDELIVDATNDELEIVKDILKQEMENVVKLEVPLVVDINSGNNWYDAK